MVGSMGFLNCPTYGNDRFDITKRQFWNDLIRLNKGFKFGINQNFGIGMSFEALPYENIVLNNTIGQNTKQDWIVTPAENDLSIPGN
jgi:hypothetical protein